MQCFYGPDRCPVSNYQLITECVRPPLTLIHLQLCLCRPGFKLQQLLLNRKQTFYTATHHRKCRNVTGISHWTTIWHSIVSLLSRHLQRAVIPASQHVLDKAHRPPIYNPFAVDSLLHVYIAAPTCRHWGQLVQCRVRVSDDLAMWQPFRSWANSLPGTNRPIGPWPIRSVAISLRGQFVSWNFFVDTGSRSGNSRGSLCMVLNSVVTDPKIL